MKDKKAKNSQIGKCLSFGKLDLIYKIEFSEKDLEKPDGNKYYNIESFNSIIDLKFMKEKKNIWDKIEMRPNNATLEQLLIGSKMSKKKMNIEYIGYGCPKFVNDEEFFFQIFNYVNNKNHFYLNEKPLIEDGPYSLKFEFTFKNKNHSFCVGSDFINILKGKDKIIKEEEEFLIDEYETNEALNEEKIPKFSRKDSILCNLNPKNKRYLLFYFNLDELKDIPGNFEKKDLLELIYFLKVNGALIFINYFKPEGEVELKGEESKEEEEMKNLNELYYLTDLYFFDFKQTIDEFDKHYKYFTTDKTKKYINKDKLFEYFTNIIASGTNKEVDRDKYGFFLEDFMKYFFIYTNKNIEKDTEFDCQLFPKVNHSNLNLISEYKKLIKKNINEYVSIFISFLISEIIRNEDISYQTIICAFLNSLTIIKRKLECEKNNINLSEKKLMEFNPIVELNLKSQDCILTSEYKQKKLKDKRFIFNSTGTMYKLNKEKEKKITIKFISTDQKIKCSIICKKSDNFKVIENKLYQYYPVLKIKKLTFLANGSKINRNETLKNNGINKDNIILIYYI